MAFSISVCQVLRKRVPKKKDCQMMVIWQSSRDSLYPYNNSIFPLCSSAFPEARHSRQYP